MSGEPTMQQLGKYEIIDELGKGSFATVYRARDTALGREVALKILHPPLVADPEFVERFQNDARAAAQLDHPHIVKVWDLGEAEGRLYIAMQLLPGGTLAQRIKNQGRMPFAEALSVVQQVAAALDCAHGQGFVHRDVKPTNILFNARGEAVLSDFGLVKAAEGSAIARSSTGGVIGTPGYIAPEVWEGKEATPATDVYALGCLAYEMLTGEPLFPGDTPPAIMLAHFQPHRYPTQWPEGVPAQVQGVLEKAVARERDQRHAGAGALAAALEGLGAEAADPLAEPYRQLLEALAAEEWQRVLQLAQQITAQDPRYRDVDQLARRAAEGQAKAERASWAAQWREQALDAESRGQPDAARVAAQRWLEMAPDDEEAQGLLRRLDEAAAETAEEPGEPPPAPKAAEGGMRIPAWLWLLIIAVTLALARVLGPGLVNVLSGPTATPTPTPWPVARITPTATAQPLQPQAGATRVWEPAGITLVYVPGGEFTMGSSAAEVDEALALCEEYRDGCQRSWFDDEQPQHQVYVDGFWIGQTEVTNAQYQRFIEAGGYTTRAYWTEDGWQWKEEQGVSEPEYWRNSIWNGSQQPVVGVSWYEAAAYAAWAGGRLPTEAEWEYAARGDDGRTFPWGDVWDGSKCNYCDRNCGYDWKEESVDDGYGYTAPVGSYAAGASPFGALDMAGNVWEWCADWYDEEYYSQSPARNPAGPSSGSSRVLRGGSWGHGPYGVRCAFRDRSSPYDRYSIVGFRVVLLAP